MKVIKFTLKSPFAFFKNKENINVNYSFPFITKTSIIGGLGAVIGLKGFKDYSKNYSIITKKIENNNLEISKIKFDELKNNISKSIDKLIESNEKKIDKKNNNLISKNETLEYIGENKSILKSIDIIKNLTIQNELLNEFKINNIFTKNIILNNNLETHLNKLNEAKLKENLLKEENQQLNIEFDNLNIEYRILFENKVAIVPKKDINFVKIVFNDATQLGVSESRNFGVVNITENILSNVEYDIYYELKDNEHDIKIMDYLLNDKRIYDFYLGKNQFIADISNVEILNLENMTQENLEDIQCESLIDVNLIKKREYNGIKINMPINNLKNGIYSDYKMLISGTYFMNEFNENIYLYNNKGIYFI